MIYTILQYLALSFGIVFMILDIRQKRTMWIFNILFAFCLGISALHNSLWANFALQIFFITMSIIGWIRWGQLKAGDNGDAQQSFTTVPLPRKTLIISAACIVLGTAILYFVLKYLQDPSPFIDGLSMILAIIATIWLTHCYKEQWLLWIAANSMILALYLTQHLWVSSAQYTIFTLCSIYGYISWTRKSKALQQQAGQTNV